MGTDDERIALDRRLEDLQVRTRREVRVHVEGARPTRASCRAESS
jgi:hypothetical protein